MLVGRGDSRESSGPVARFGRRFYGGSESVGSESGGRVAVGGRSGSQRGRLGSYLQLGLASLPARESPRQDGSRADLT